MKPLSTTLTHTGQMHTPIWRSTWPPLSLWLIWMAAGWWLHGLHGIEPFEIPELLREYAFYTALALCWASGWGIVNWIVFQRSRFAVHPGIAMGMLAVDRLLIEMGLPMLIFAWNLTWHPLIYWLLLSVLIAAGVGMHLHTMFEHWSVRLTGIVAGVLLALASHEGLNALADGLETSDELPYHQNLYPYRGDVQSLPDAKSALETLWPER